MILLVTYDLKRPGQDYPSLHEGIESLGSWAHFLESTWILDTSYSPEQVTNKLIPLIDQNDRLLIFEVKRNSMPGG